MTAQQPRKASDAVRAINLLTAFFKRERKQHEAWLAEREECRKEEAKEEGRRSAEANKWIAEARKELAESKERIAESGRMLAEMREQAKTDGLGAANSPSGTGDATNPSGTSESSHAADLAASQPRAHSSNEPSGNPQASQEREDEAESEMDRMMREFREALEAYRRDQQRTKRPPLPHSHANPFLATANSSGTEGKYQVISRNGQDIVVGRVKIQTPNNGNAFVL